MNKNLPIPKNEEARLAALAQYNILDTLPEEEFDRLTQLASIICGVPIALITLVDKDRQWFKSKIGLDTPETPRDIYFCQYVINGESLLEVEDATKDERFLSNPLVTDQPNIRFYAGYPLIDPAGYALGSLCLIDRVARKLTADQRRALTLLANEVVSQIVSRKKNAEKDKLEKMFELSTDLICVASTDGYFKKLNPAFTLTLGWTIEELLAKPFYDFMHPDDVTKSINEIKKIIAKGEKTTDFENRYLTKNGEYLPISWHANFDEITGEFYSVGRDISERTKAEELLTEYKHFFYNTANFACIANVQGYFEVINPNFEEILGYTERELLESQFLNFIHPDDIDSTLKEIEKLQNGAKTINFENRYRKKDGNYLWFDWNTTPNPVTGKLYAIARDITEQKKAKSLITQSEEHNRFIMNSALNSIVTINSSQKITFWNQQAEAIFGWKKEEVLGKKMIDLIIPLRHRAKWVKIINDFDKTAESTYLRKLLELKLIHKAGHEFFGEASIIAIFQKGETYFCGFLQDISKRKQFENQLIHSENRNKLVMNASLNAIITIDSKGIITFWNQKAEIIFGWNNEEVLGKDLYKVIIPPQYIDTCNKGLKHFLKTGEGPVLNAPLNFSALNRKGIEFPIEMSIIPLYENNQVFFCAFIQDVSEKKEAENIRKIQEEKYQNVIAHMNLGLIEVDNQEIIQYVNPSFASMCGYEISELIGQNPSDVFLSGESIDIILSKNELRKQGASDNYQLSINNKRGELRWWAISGAPNYDSKGNVIGSIGIHMDITEQKQLEIDLEKEKTKALESSKAKEMFLANMSHEMRTPLNAIIGFLRELDKQELSELQRKYIDNSSIASKHLLAIINNILDISKIEAGEMSLESEDFVFEKSITNVAKVLQPMLDQKRLKLNITISKEVEKVLKGDTLRLQQILFNLVGNAIKFTNEGSISINCEVVEDNTISQKLQISISDTGIGMESSFIENVFNKFSQEDRAITRKYGGTGLGLSITSELVKLMNGHIEITSKKNIGTTVSIYLDYTKGSKKFIEDQETDKPSIKLDNISILLVEDNYMNRMVAQNSLQYFNCEVTEAENGVEAIAILKDRKFDIILMDIQMPEMGGIEATEIIRKELNLTTPIIALTANAFKTEIDKCKKAGMDDYVTKPFDEDILIETIAKHTVNKTILFQEPEFPTKSSTNNLYNLTFLQNLSRGNNEFVDKMVAIFVEQTTDTIIKLTTAISIQDFKEVSRLIHKIKPSVESLGIASINSEIKLLEKTAEIAKDKEQIRVLFEIVKEVLEQTVLQLIDYTKKE